MLITLFLQEHIILSLFPVCGSFRNSGRQSKAMSVTPIVLEVSHMPMINNWRRRFPCLALSQEKNQINDNLKLKVSIT